MNKQTAKIFLSFYICVLMITFVLVLVFNNKILADPDMGELISKSNITVKLNGKNENFGLRQYKKDKQNKNYLFKNSFLQTSNIILPGFEDEIKLCPEGVLKLKGDDLICLTGDVGAHSKNLVLVKYSDHSIIKINFYENGIKSQNIFSDVPNFQFIKNGDGQMIEIYDDNRNYDKDPLKDAKRKIFKADNQGFVFDKEENITYN